MKTKVLLLREDGQEKIYCKAYDANGNISKTEFSITYDEWDAIKKTRIEKNVWELDIPETEQDKRISWMLEPQRMVLVLRALASKEVDDFDIHFVYSLGSVLEDYQIEFKQAPIQFIQDARKAKEVFEFMLSSDR